MKIEISGKQKDYKLCYVDKHYDGVYFADCEPTEVWGDDWNDAPYEHNCGSPYNHRKDESNKDIPIEFIVIHFAGNYETPASKAWGGNSAYSVEMINHKMVAWLAPSEWEADIKKYPPIFAGTTLQEFVNIILVTDGVIYFPHTMLSMLKEVEHE